MRKTLFVLALAVVLIIAFATTAFAEHAPSNYSQWKTTVGDNAAIQSPHAGYTANTVKCSVCHSVHRSAVDGQEIRNVVNGDWIRAQSHSGETEMLLRSGVEDSCSYCHIDSAAGGVRLWNGNSANWGETQPFSSGYGHNHTACVECHAVHGAYTFKGAAAGKTLKYNASQFVREAAKSPASGDGLARYTDAMTGESVLTGIQDEIYVEGNDAIVDPLNVAQFSSLADVIEGGTPIHDAAGADVKDLQVGAFCTTCHQTYAYASEATVNIDRDVMLWGGGYRSEALGGWENADTSQQSKGHPVKDASADFYAEGMELATGQTVAWSDADTCRKCHDAGTDDAPAGVVYSSFPHVTPGYYRFMGAGASVDLYDAATKAAVAGGHVAGVAGDQVFNTTIGSLNEASLYNLYPGQNYKSDNPAAPQQADHIGTDGLCLKCHVKSNVPGQAKGVGYTF